MNPVVSFWQARYTLNSLVSANIVHLMKRNTVNASNGIVFLPFCCVDFFSHIHRKCYNWLGNDSSFCVFFCHSLTLSPRVERALTTSGWIQSNFSKVNRDPNFDGSILLFALFLRINFARENCSLFACSQHFIGV